MNTSKTVVGVDIAKRVFQLHWVEMATGEVMTLQLKRDKFLRHFATRMPCLIGMEACGSAQHWARQLQSLGHAVKLLPAKAVKPFVGGQQERCPRCAGDRVDDWFRFEASLALGVLSSLPAQHLQELDAVIAGEDRKLLAAGAA
jgi:hypothetical protein